MSRIIQMRRGTTAENDNFTGLPGEVTFDTDAKTLRVHDGATLGGFALARADAGGDEGATGDFDITTVPDETWAQIFAAHSPAPFATQSSQQCPLNNGYALEYIFSGTTLPFLVQTVLVCQSAEAGYNVGDECGAFGVGTRTNPAPNTYVDGDGIHVVFMIGSQSFWVSHKSTGATTNITNDNWRIMFRIYC